MKRAGNEQYEIRLLPNASHGMMFSRTGGPKEHPFESRFVQGYFDVMTAWLAKRAR